VGAVLLYFARDLKRLTAAFVQGLIAKQPFGTPDSRLAWFVGLGTLPIGVLGLAFKKSIETSLRSLYVISGSLIALAVVLAVVERLAKHTRTLDGMTLKEALTVGAWQALALIPGSSRSGVTLTGALSLGFTRAEAARYSFLLSIPATTLAGLLQLKHLRDMADAPPMSMLVVGTVVSFFTGLLAIWGLLQFLRARSTLVFIVYRVVLGVTLLGLLSAGVLQP
jgi:undecaprenyl-diphosphatase